MEVRGLLIARTIILPEPASPRIRCGRFLASQSQLTYPTDFRFAISFSMSRDTRRRESPGAPQSFDGAES